MIDADTKRLRKLIAYAGETPLHPHERNELRSLILAVCEELERLRQVELGFENGDQGIEIKHLTAENKQLRAALEQANRTAEELARHKERGVVTPEQFALIYTMRENRKKLIGP